MTSLVGLAEVVPVDGAAPEPAVLDESVLTGESVQLDGPPRAPSVAGP